MTISLIKTAHSQKTILKLTSRQVVLELTRDVPWQKTTCFTQPFI